jgi:phosphomannomutase
MLAEEARRGGLRSDVPEVTRRRTWRRHVLALRPCTRVKNDRAKLKIVYTAMHGVGEQLMLQVLAEPPGSHGDLVAEQAEPDGRVPHGRVSRTPKRRARWTCRSRSVRSVRADLVRRQRPRRRPPGGGRARDATGKLA